MSNREKIVSLLDSVPQYKLGYVLAYVQGLTADEGDEDVPYSLEDFIRGETDTHENR